VRGRLAIADRRDIPGPDDQASERASMLACPQSRSHMFALRMRWIIGFIHPRVDEAQRACRRDESLQTDSAEGVPSFSVESELRQGVEAAGNEPASLLEASLCNQTIYNTSSGGGGNCTRGRTATSTELDCTCENGRCWWSEMGRADAALAELVENWHRLTLSVKSSIMELIRGGRVSI
jgi:hypothetical protein